MDEVIDQTAEVSLEVMQTDRKTDGLYIGTKAVDNSNIIFLPFRPWDG